MRFTGSYGGDEVREWWYSVADLEGGGRAASGPHLGDGPMSSRYS